jgi:hypothetical protein
LPNLVKYALGLSPFTAYTNTLSPRIQGGQLALTYPVATVATDVALTFEYSNDLKTWYSGPGHFQQTGVLDQGAIQIITLQAVTPTNATDATFIRLHASRR